MDPELARIRDAMDKATGGGRDLDLARQLATQYVETHPDRFAAFEDLTRDECVAEVVRCCEAGLLEDQWIVETWLLHNWEPMLIVGGINWVAPDDF